MSLQACRNDFGSVVWGGGGLLNILKQKGGEEVHKLRGGGGGGEREGCNPLAPTVPNALALKSNQKLLWSLTCYYLVKRPTADTMNFIKRFGSK